ncbi:hypothetical protein [Streptomyces sp. NPDC018045]|uniref:hypothetical protein n=1 Tax=Streptomyces sp. NPDC018045 TaxID=3365037 RepID=UPI0037968A25
MPNGDGTWANRYGEQLTVDEVDTVRPVAMYLVKRGWKDKRPDLTIAVPVDLDVSLGGRAEVARQAPEVRTLLEAHGIACVPVSSGPSGGIHLWTYCLPGLPPSLVARIGQLLAVLFSTVDNSNLNEGAGGLLRPPGAAHRSGQGHAQLTEHTVEQAVAILRPGTPPAAYEALLRTLEVRAGGAAPALLSRDHQRDAPQDKGSGGPRSRRVPPSIQKRGKPLRSIGTDGDGHRYLEDVPWRPLGSRALRYLQRAPRSDSGAHQAAVHAALCACAVNGWRIEDARTLVEDAAASPVLEWLRTTADPSTGTRTALSEREAARRFERAWFLAVEDAARLPRRPSDRAEYSGECSPGAQAAADLLARIEQAGPDHWGRPSGPATRDLLRAVAYRMWITGSPVVSANIRALGTLMGRSKSTGALGYLRASDDGWLTTVSEAKRAAGISRRVTAATSHRCTDDPHHRCAPGSPSTDSEFPGQHGSDRKCNAARPPKGGGGVTVVPTVTVWGGRLQQLRETIAQQQAGLWHHIGHHALRTLEALQAGVQPADLMEATGYVGETVQRHLEALEEVGLVRAHQESGTGRVVVELTGRSLYEASAQVGTASRPAELAVAARIDQEVHRWFWADVAWCRMPIKDKRAQGMRAEPESVPCDDPHEHRKFPRHRNPATGRPGRADFARAWEIEAARIGAAALAVEADQSARDGRVVDPAALGRPQVRAEQLELPLAA